MSSWDEHCGSCVFMDTSDENEHETRKGEYYCQEKGEYRCPGDICCNLFREK